MEEQKLNRQFWAFVYLITSYPDIYLSKTGKVIHQLVLKEGICESISSMTKSLHVTRKTTYLLCKNIKETNTHIQFVKEENRKEIHFSENILNKGLEIANSILKE